MLYTRIKSIDERIKEKIEAAETRKYFLMRDPNECIQSIPELESVVNECKVALNPFYKTSWYAALKDAEEFAFYASFGDASLQAVKDKVWRVAYKAAYDAALEAALEPDVKATWHDVCAIREAANKAAGIVALDVIWEFLKDFKVYKNNPFEKIVKMYEMGLCPRGFREVEGSERFVVDFSLKKHKLGCWAENSKQISYTHKWTEGCRY